jgi:DNA-directed RNA polymerase III subunit RPC7
MANPETGLIARKRKSRLNVDLLGEGEEGDEVEDDTLDIEVDENWEDDDDEGLNYEENEKDDYNAEQYFENGEDDMGGDDEEGGGGGDYE